MLSSWPSMNNHDQTRHYCDRSHTWEKSPWPSFPGNLTLVLRLAMSHIDVLLQHWYSKYDVVCHDYEVLGLQITCYIGVLLNMSNIEGALSTRQKYGIRWNGHWSAFMRNGHVLKPWPSWDDGLITSASSKTVIWL